MLVYLTHPNHGTHIAYDDAEVERCKANGWSLREPVKAVVEPAVEPIAEKKKPGRPKKA